MAPKNIILLILLVLIVSTIESAAQNNNLFGYKKQSVVEFNMDIFSLFHLIEGNMPLTRQKIEDIGFVLVKTREKDGYTDYIATPVDLNDGAKLVNIDLWERNDESGRHIFFILDIKNRVVTRKELENHLGSFALLPDGDITLGKTAIYEKIVRGSEFSALYTQAPQNILLNVSFSSIEPLEQ